MVASLVSVCTLLWATSVVADTFSNPSQPGFRRATKGKKLLTSKVKRKNNGEDLLLQPLAGPMLPYFDNIEFKSPCLDKRDIKISVDTGSSDFWIDASLWCKCDKGRQAKNQLCSELKQERKNKDFWLRYDDNFNVRGTYMEGDFSLYDADNTEFLLEGFGFVAAYAFENAPTGPNAMTGSIGLGFTNDQQIQEQIGSEYYTLPEKLEINQNTTSNAFSMWFESTGAKEDFSAKIMFGGYVKNYYQGRLTNLKVIRDDNWQGEVGDGGGQKIIVQLDEIIHDGKRIFDKCDKFQPVLLDTGSFGSYLPQDAFETLAKRMGPHVMVENSNRKIAVFEDCSKWDKKEQIKFRFGEVDISVPIWDNLVRFVTAKEVSSGQYPMIKDPKKQCLTHGIATWPAETSRNINFALSKKSLDQYADQRSILGITFLRHAFIVYDLDREQVAIAPISQKSIDTEEGDSFEFDDQYAEKTGHRENDYDVVPGRAERCTR